MEKIVAYKIIPELKLIIEIFSGKISLDDAIELKRKEVLDRAYNSKFNYIVSINEIESEGRFDYDFSKYIETIKEDNKILGVRKSAIITKTPKQVVAGTLYEIASRELPMNFKIVSSIKAALNWIDISNDFETTVTENIELLKKNAT
jgi:hypothetical protein